MNTEIDCPGSGVIVLDQDELVLFSGGFPWGALGVGVVASMVGGALLEVLGSWDDFVEGVREGFEYALEVEGG